MLYKHATRTRQSPMQKAIGYGAQIGKFVGTARAAWDPAGTIYGLGQAAAPYVSAAAAMLV